MLAPILAAAALASVARAQNFDFNLVLAAPSPAITAAPVAGTYAGVIPFNTASASASVVSDVSTVATAAVTGASASALASAGPAVAKRQECSAEPGGHGPQVSPDTPEAFEQDSEFHLDADFALTPFNYYNSFRDLNASTQANSYITYYILESYNTTECAAYCNSIELCTAFNIYVERDPSVEPGPDCPNPPSISNYKCALWGSSITAQTATNDGQYQEDFEVVISGSNGYNQFPSLPSLGVDANFTLGLNLSTAAMNLGGKVFMGADFVAGPYDPSLCATYANTQTEINIAAAEQVLNKSYTPVNMFNSYNVLKDGVPQGTYCALFDTNLSADFANFTGDVYLGSSFTLESSFTYVRAVLDTGVIVY